MNQLNVMSTSWFTTIDRQPHVPLPVQTHRLLSAYHYQYKYIDGQNVQIYVQNIDN